MKRIVQIALFAFILLGVGVAFAQSQPAAAKSDDGWQQVDGSMMQKGESIPASRLVGGAYGFICAAIVVWVATVAARARRLEDEVESLKKKLQARA